jgi:histone H3/H4
MPEKEPQLIIKSKVKSAVPELAVSSDVPHALNKKVLDILDKASERAKANGRRTLQARDL